MLSGESDSVLMNQNLSGKTHNSARAEQPTTANSTQTEQHGDIKTHEDDQVWQ